MSKTCDNCGHKSYCPWVNTTYCTNWIDNKLGKELKND